MRLAAIEVVNQIFKPDNDRYGRPQEKFIDFDRPHTYKWTENKHLDISDPNYFTIDIIYLDKEPNNG